MKSIDEQLEIIQRGADEILVEKEIGRASCRERVLTGV